MNLSAHFTLAELTFSETAIRMGRGSVGNAAPVSALLDQADHRGADAILLREFLLNCPGGDGPTNLRDLHGSQLRFAIQFTNRGFSTAMLRRICGVLLWRAPSKIGESVVRWIAIVVAAVHPIWTWANECGKNQAVSPRVLSRALFAEQQLDVSTIVSVEPENPASRATSANAAQAALIAYLVETLVPDHRTPLFHEALA